MEFNNGPIAGVILEDLKKFTDERGWLAEIFRNDQLAEPLRPAMGYVSVTLPGVLRGPHEHVEQADLFCWLGPGDFKVTLWDNRPESPTYKTRMEFCRGVNHPGSALIPHGVVHCYRCISAEPGLVTNCPNQLFAGEGKRYPIDEIRHEDDPQNPFVLDELDRRVHGR